MANKKFRWGMLVLALVLVLTVVGCKESDDDDADYIYTYTFENKSSFTVRVKSDDLKPSDFTISSGKTTTAKSKKNKLSFTYYDANQVTSNTSDGKCTFYDK